jgi:hypothetical protein
MVHELVTGKRTVQEARHTSEQSTVAYNAGRAALYAERLLFEVPKAAPRTLTRATWPGRCCSRRSASSRTRSPLGAGRKPATVAPPADPQRRLVQGRWAAGTGGRPCSGRGGKSNGRLSGTLRRPPSPESQQRRPLLVPPRRHDPYPLARRLTSRLAPARSRSV